MSNYVPPSQSDETFMASPELQPPSSKKSKKTWLIVLIVVLVLCCCLIVVGGVAAYFLTQGGSEFNWELTSWLPTMLA